MYSRILLVFLVLVFSAGSDVAFAQCGPDAWQPVVTVKKVRGKNRRVVRKATKAFESLADYKFDISGPDWLPEKNKEFGLSGRKSDQYGRVNFCEEKARADNFSFELQNDPASNGYIVVSGPPGDFQKQGHASHIVDYLVNQRGIERSRLVTVNAGESDSLEIQLWVVPKVN